MTLAAHASTDFREAAPAAQTIMALMHTSSLAKAVCVATELEIVDLLARGPMAVDDLARATRTHSPALHRLLRALACTGLCVECSEGRFALTALGARLRAGTEGSLRSWVLWWGRHQWSAWDHLLYSIRTGESGRKLAFGSDGFDYLERDPQAAALFHGAMAEMTHIIADEVVRNYDFTGTRQFADIGGGTGILAAAILRAQPSMRGMIFDRSQAIEGAKAHFASNGLVERCNFVTGDFFTSIPNECNLLILKSIIHDWDDERSLAILRNCRKAMPKEGRILLIERALPAQPDSSPNHRAIVCSDLAMLIGPGGRERTVSELTGLLRASGIPTARVVGSVLEYSLIEGTLD
jgi:hypothetical protein